MRKTPSSHWGRRLLPSRIDELAQQAPKKIWVSIPSRNPADGFQDITWAIAANAINCAAWWIESTLGPGGGSTPIAYMGLQDIRYPLLLVAAIKSGYVLFLPSPRNSAEDQVHLLQETKCKTFLHTTSTNLQEILERLPIKTIVVPELKEWLGAGIAPLYPYNAKYEVVKQDPYVIFHTSSSTGRPRSIQCPHSTSCQCDTAHLIPDLDGRETTWVGVIENNCGRLFCPMPFFHAAGITNVLAVPAFLGTNTVVAPADGLTNAGMVSEILEYGNIDVALLPPSLLEDLSESPLSLARLGKLKGVIYGGGPLAKNSGDILCKHVRLHNWLGSTENGTVHSHVADADAWEYFCIDPKYNGIDWRATPEKGVFEMVYVRDPNLAQFQDVFKVFDNLEEFSTKDLFRKHPSKPHHWRHEGRVDDILVFSNGEKYMPARTEEMISAHPKLRSALLVGHGRFNAAAILEPRDFPKCNTDAIRLLDSVWPMVEMSNKQAPTHGMLSRSYIILAAPDKPFLRTPKGTLRRAATLKCYEAEINELYSNPMLNPTIQHIAISFQSQSALILSLVKLIHQLTNVDVAIDGDLFIAGINSLHVMNILAVIKKSLLEANDKLDPGLITPNLLYRHSTLQQLSSALLRLRDGRLKNEASDKERYTIFQQIIEDYTLRPPPSPYTPKISKSLSPRAVILTGSTGSLGPEILSTLLSNPTISRIYCLDRSPNAKARLTATNPAKGLSTAFSNVSFLQVDLTKPFFGATEATYNELARNVQYIIHNAYPVSFTLPPTSFEPHLHTIINLLSFANCTSPSTHLLFISTLSPPTSAYAASKRAAEQIISRSSFTNHSKATILRLGQLSGPVTRAVKGEWPKREWLPAMMEASKAMGLLPARLPGSGELRWIPVDVAGRVVAEIAEAVSIGAGSEGGCEDKVRCLDIANPKPTTWGNLLPHAVKTFGGEVIDLEEWVGNLVQRAESGWGKDLVAIRLLGWFKGCVGQGEDRGAEDIDLGEACRMSRSLRELGPVTGEWMHLWLRQWGYEVNDGV